MNTIDNTPQCIDGQDHRLITRRERGSRSRGQCSRCNLWTGWRKVEQVTGREKLRTVNEKVEQGKLVKADDTVSATFWNGATVADLKQMCKDKGITGYSKMKRDDLLAVLGAV